jgi:hypothetical protein
MNKEKAFEYLTGSIIKAGVDFSYKGGAIFVSGLEIKCSGEALIVSTQYANNHFNLDTLCYICVSDGYLWISDNQRNVFSSYKLGR